MSKYMENAELVMKFFDKNGWGPYNMLDDGCAARFFGEICGFEGLFKSFHFLLFVGDDVVESYVTYPISAKDKILQVSEFITRANYELKYGAFEMDYSNGEVRFHLALPMSAVRADEDLLPLMIGLPPTILDKYAKGFFDVLMGVKTPEEAIKDCKGDGSVELRFRSRGERGHTVKTQKEEE